MLQGPAGPFFARVARQLRAAGAHITKVNFNGGEDLYFREQDVVRFRGTRQEWTASCCSATADRCTAWPSSERARAVSKCSCSKKATCGQTSSRWSEGE